MIAKTSLFILILCLPALAAEPADLWMDEGLKLLKERPETSLVQAAGLFAKAADAYEAKGDQTKAAEANSCLYWTRKKFTVRETGIILKGNPVAAQRMEKIVAEKPKEEDAKGYFERAETFAKTSKDSLLTAIRYFEVADRFPSTEQGRRAMDASLKAMMQVSAKASVTQAAKPAEIAAPSSASPILGKWDVAKKDGSRNVWEFKADGTMTAESGDIKSATWKIVGNKLQLKYVGVSSVSEFALPSGVVADTLTFYDRTLTRKN